MWLKRYGCCFPNGLARWNGNPICDKCVSQPARCSACLSDWGSQLPEWWRTSSPAAHGPLGWCLAHPRADTRPAALHLSQGNRTKGNRSSLSSWLVDLRQSDQKPYRGLDHSSLHDILNGKVFNMKKTQQTLTFTTDMLKAKTILLNKEASA